MAKFIRTVIDPEGYYAYTVVVDAMIKHPNYGRYLFAHDDMAMNVSKLMEIDRKLAVFATTEDEEKYGSFEWSANRNLSAPRHGEYYVIFILFFFSLF
jgi:hypothetical protein